MTPITEESLKIGDTVTFNNVDLYYASTDEEANGNTSDLTDYKYKATAISVVHDNQVMNLVYNDSISLDELDKVCKNKYGDDYKISINFDLVDDEDNVITESVGWVNCDDAKAAKLVLK